LGDGNPRIGTSIEKEQRNFSLENSVYRVIIHLPAHGRIVPEVRNFG
jgi:hypothetical protein